MNTATPPPPTDAAADAVLAPVPGTSPAARRHIHDPLWLRCLLIGAALLFLFGFLLAPLAAVFAEALRNGFDAYLASFADADVLAALRLTLLTAAITVPANVVFGVSAAWAVTKYDFRGKSFLITLIDLPFAISPVIAGLIFVLVFGRHGWLGPANMEHLFSPIAPGLAAFVEAHGWQDTLLGGLSEWMTEPSVLPILFSTPGIVLATIFVSFPFVARELIPLMQAQGRDEELAAITLGASGWQTFRRVTLPNIKWGLFYGVILCNARAMGEFGAVSVVSGKIRGETNTLPLHVEILYNEYNSSAAFAVASLLAMLAIVTLVLKSFAEWKFKRTNANAS
jgi:sulfate transport system permease protein